MKIDIVISHPYEIRYPLWEKIMERNQKYFNSIIVCFTPGEILRKDFSEAIKKELGEKVKNAVFLDFPGIAGQGDWRNTATNFGIDNSQADAILFLEQDLIMPDMRVATSFDNLMLYIMENGRVHPAFLRIKREEIEKTERNFAPVQEKGLDHFDLFVSQLVCPRIMINNDLYYHMAGYTDNCRLEWEGKQPNYKTDEFKLFKLMEKLL